MTLRYFESAFHSIKYIKNLKTLWPLLWMWFNCLRAIATWRRQFTFYHKVPRNSWYSFYRPRKDEGLSRPWSHPVVLNTAPLDWESSVLTTRSLLHFVLTALFVLTLASDMAVLHRNDPYSILIPSSKKRYSSFLKNVFVFKKIYFKVKVLKIFKISTDCHTRTYRSVKQGYFE